LLRDGKSVFPRQTRIRHPRSVVGWNNRFIFLVEVDGRQRELSVGMTFEELSQYLLKIDCQNAMCLDGGGSSTLWALGQVMNNPSEGSERGSANGLVVLAKESH
jgi:large repetitive protein